MRATPTMLVLLLLRAAPLAAEAPDPATPPEAAVADASDADASDADVTARLDFLVQRLDEGRSYADHWARGWIALFSLSAATSAGWAVTRRDPAGRTDAFVGAAKATLGAATHVTTIAYSANRGAADVLALPRATPDQRRAALGVAERILRTNARDEGQRRSWLRHLGNLAVNVAGGLIVGLVHHDWRIAGLSTAVGIGGGEAVIWSQPWRAPGDWADYEARFGAASR